MEKELKYKGNTITVKFPSGMFEYYSDSKKKFLKFDTLKAAKESIDKEKKSVKESVEPKTQKIKLSEVRQLVKKMLKEESVINEGMMFFDYILQGEDATEDNAIQAAQGLDWQEIEVHEGNYPYLDYIDTVNGVGIYHNYGHNAYYFTDETSESMQESVKPKTQKIKLSEVRQMVKKMLKESNYDFVSQYDLGNTYLTSLGLEKMGIETLQTYVNLILKDKNWLEKKYPNYNYSARTIIEDIKKIVKNLPEFIDKHKDMNPISVANNLKSKL